jgi:hypothetical protein
MNRLKLFAFKANQECVNFISFSIPSLMLSKQDHLLEPMARRVSEKYVITVYLNRQEIEFDINREVNKRLSKEDRMKLSELIGYMAES